MVDDLVKKYRAAGDRWRMLAAEMFGVKLEEVTEQQRLEMKRMFFFHPDDLSGVATAEIARRTGIPEEELRKKAAALKVWYSELLGHQAIPLSPRNPQPVSVLTFQPALSPAQVKALSQETRAELVKCYADGLSRIGAAAVLDAHLTDDGIFTADIKWEPKRPAEGERWWTPSDVLARVQRILDGAVEMSGIDAYRRAQEMGTLNWDPEHPPVEKAKHLMELVKRLESQQPGFTLKTATSEQRQEIEQQMAAKFQGFTLSQAPSTGESYVLDKKTIDAVFTPQVGTITRSPWAPLSAAERAKIEEYYTSVVRNLGGDVKSARWASDKEVTFDVRLPEVADFVPLTIHSMDAGPVDTGVVLSWDLASIGQDRTVIQDLKVDAAGNPVQSIVDGIAAEVGPLPPGTVTLQGEQDELLGKALELAVGKELHAYLKIVGGGLRSGDLMLMVGDPSKGKGLDLAHRIAQRQMERLPMLLGVDADAAKRIKEAYWNRLHGDISHAVTHPVAPADLLLTMHMGKARSIEGRMMTDALARELRNVVMVGDHIVVHEGVVERFGDAEQAEARAEVVNGIYVRPVYVGDSVKPGDFGFSGERLMRMNSKGDLVPATEDEATAYHLAQAVKQSPR